MKTFEFRDPHNANQPWHKLEATTVLEAAIEAAQQFGCCEGLRKVDVEIKRHGVFRVECKAEYSAAKITLSSFAKSVAKKS